MLTLINKKNVAVSAVLIFALALTPSFAERNRNRDTKSQERSAGTKQVSEAPSRSIGKSVSQTPVGRISRSANSARESALSLSKSGHTKEVSPVRFVKLKDTPEVAKPARQAKGNVLSGSSRRESKASPTITTTAKPDTVVAEVQRPRRTITLLEGVTRPKAEADSSASKLQENNHYRGILASKGRPAPDVKADKAESKSHRKTSEPVINATNIANVDLERDTSIRPQFTRPADEKRQFVRPSDEKPQFVRPASKSNRNIRPELKEYADRSAQKITHERNIRYAPDTHHSKHIRCHENEHVYIDRHNRLCHRIIWPAYHYVIYYNWGPHFVFRTIYPYYHRKYVFVSLCGYWPEYSYVRYYWYGCYPYNWYGYYPVAREVVSGDTYNYYTYNYYGTGYSDNAASCEYSRTTDTSDRPIDENTFADVREKLAREKLAEQAGQPAPETTPDKYFDQAVKAFEANDYAAAADSLASAVNLAPDDMVLPFAWSQALLACEQYQQAAAVLRSALAKVSPEKQGLFYPRGLYAEDNILFEQISRLADKADASPYDADLQLLLGYQLLGIGKVKDAVAPLQQARQDLTNAASAEILLSLLDKMRTNETKSTNQ